LFSQQRNLFKNLAQTFLSLHFFPIRVTFTVTFRNSGIMNVQDTICAVSTPPGTGGIAVIRLSGKDAVKVADKVVVPLQSGLELATAKANRSLVGHVVSDGEILDEVVVTLFRKPHSYTGEDVVEISCHGSLFIQQEILRILVDQGARMALPGEFTQRAFLNRKMDLSQAEAVADLIASSTAASHKIALQQMRGGFSDEIRNLREELLKFTALIELELDFSEEDVEFADRSALAVLVRRISILISRLVESFRLGNVIKNGIPVAIVGETNVGKSTLLNALVKEEKAIVSDIHGTTRDVIEDVVNIHGTAFRFFDTAGIRDTSNEIETKGIEKTFSKLRQAEIVLLVVDLSSPAPTLPEIIGRIRKLVDSRHLIIVANKADRQVEESAAFLQALPLLPNEDLVFISAKRKENLDGLIDRMKETLAVDKVGSSDVVVSNVRHYEALKMALAAIQRVEEGLGSRISGDFLAQDIRECLHYLSDIIGEVTDNEVLGYIFKNFCIGK
jgi:tRNA modification GTPase